MASRRITSSWDPCTVISPRRYFWTGFRSPQNMSQKISEWVVTTMSGMPTCPGGVERISPRSTSIENVSSLSEQTKCRFRDQSRCILRSRSLPLQVTV